QVITLEAPVVVLGQGSGRVVATALQVACNAYVADRFHQIRNPTVSAERPPPVAVLPVRPVCTPAARVHGNSCVAPGSHHAGVCTYTPVTSGTLCDDGNACTAADGCLAGQCLGSAVNCDDANVCTTDGCDPATGCTHTPISCDDANPCTTDTCNPASGCLH